MKNKKKTKTPRSSRAVKKSIFDGLKDAKENRGRAYTYNFMPRKTYYLSESQMAELKLQHSISKITRFVRAFFFELSKSVRAGAGSLKNGLLIAAMVSFFAFIIVSVSSAVGFLAYHAFLHRWLFIPENSNFLAYYAPGAILLCFFIPLAFLINWLKNFFDRVKDRAGENQ